jgi:AraC-like DNA-binding protein
MTMSARIPLFKSTPQIIECCCSNASIPRHFHAKAYATVVLAGSFEETGSRGRFRVEPGDVLLHNAFDTHLNRVGKVGAKTLNLPLTDSVPNLAHGRVSDVDAIVRIAERDPDGAAVCLLDRLQHVSPRIDDWPDILACDLASDQNSRLDRWSLAHGLAPETISRGFFAAYGTTPARFRAEARARRALHQIVFTTSPLAEIAACLGFSDQPHMTRAVRELTGMPPRNWRARAI